MDEKRDSCCRIATDVLFAACYGFPSCAVNYAAVLEWVAGRRSIGCHDLYFHTVRIITKCPGRIFPKKKSLVDMRDAL